MFALIPCIVFISPRVIHDLIHDLRDGNWVASRTIWGTKTSTVGVRDVTLMVGRVKIDAIPAGWEDDGCTNTLGAVLEGKLASIFVVAWGKALPVTEASMA